MAKSGKSDVRLLQIAFWRNISMESGRLSETTGLFKGNHHQISNTLALVSKVLYRDEMKKVDAIREFYNKGAINDETIVYGLTSFGKYGIPTIFLIFTITYWTTGILKYFLS